MLQHYFYNTCMKFFFLSTYNGTTKVLERCTWKKRWRRQRKKERLEDFRMKDRKKNTTEQRKTIIYFTYFHS